MSSMIPVTKPFLPSADEFCSYIKDIWERNWLTNNGPLVNELELRLKEFLNVNHLLFLSNGTVGLQIAIKALDLKGEIITTPFSYVATSSSIVWEGCTPVFVDIDEASLNIDARLIEAAITENTSAILATHTYGNPCEIESIEAIAAKHHIKVIYDAAHCFGTLYKGHSVYDFGDVSVASFHATKLFHTVEGGAVFTGDAELLKKMAYMRNFGHDGPDNFACVGINGKNSEIHAAMGLLNIKHIPSILETRKKISEQYDIWMQHLNLRTITKTKESVFNYSYYPVIFETEEALLKATSLLNDNWIYPRRYFYPALHKLNYVQSGTLPVCESISQRVMCLPLYHTLSKEEVDFICRLLLRAQNN
jgi:dTDP-4-amino-4,6-dideoxygalactose transaminase